MFQNNLRSQYAIYFTKHFVKYGTVPILHQLFAVMGAIVGSREMQRHVETTNAQMQG
jgi:hypothetical protein